MSLNIAAAKLDRSRPVGPHIHPLQLLVAALPWFAGLAGTIAMHDNAAPVVAGAVVGEDEQRVGDRAAGRDGKQRDRPRRPRVHHDRRLCQRREDVQRGPARARACGAARGGARP